MIYGHPKYLAETFVDLSLYRGSCYRAANWIYLGKTKGFSKNGRYYYPNGRPKGLFVYPLIKGIERLLGGEFLSEGGSMNTKDILFMNKLPIEGLMEVIKRVVDPRSGNPPDESTIRRAIQRVDVYEFDKLISGWLRG
jgi:hypothetical protein